MSERKKLVNIIQYPTIKNDKIEVTYDFVIATYNSVIVRIESDENNTFVGKHIMDDDGLDIILIERINNFTTPLFFVNTKDIFDYFGIDGINTVNLIRVVENLVNIIDSFFINPDLVDDFMFASKTFEMSLKGLGISFEKVWGICEKNYANDILISNLYPFKHSIEESPLTDWVHECLDKINFLHTFIDRHLLS